MTIKWNVEELMFDSLYEAEVWADSIANEMYARLYNGYETPDYKIAYSLAFRLAEIKEFTIRTARTIDRYQVWVTINS